MAVRKDAEPRPGAASSAAAVSRSGIRGGCWAPKPRPLRERCPPRAALQERRTLVTWLQAARCRRHTTVYMSKGPSSPWARPGPASDADGSE